MSKERDCLFFFLQLTLKNIKNSNNRTAIKRLVTSTKLYFYYQNIFLNHVVIIFPPLSSLGQSAGKPSTVNESRNTSRNTLTARRTLRILINGGKARTPQANKWWIHLIELFWPLWPPEAEVKRQSVFWTSAPVDIRDPSGQRDLRFCLSLQQRQELTWQTGFPSLLLQFFCSPLRNSKNAVDLSPGISTGNRK